MPSPEKLQEYIELSLEVESAKLLHREAMNNFTSLASKLNYMLLDEFDYGGYIYRREPPPEWLRQLPNKAWIFREKKPKEHSRRKPKKVKDKTFEKLYSNMMEGFK